MELQIDQHGHGIIVVKPKGRLDLITATDVRQQLANLVTGQGQRIIVDLYDVSFVDSSGLGALISGLKAARLAGGDLRIARPNEQMLTILKLTTLDRVLRPYATLEEALAGYA